MAIPVKYIYMIKALLIATLFTLTACNRIYDQYKTIINDVDRIDIHYKNTGRDIRLSTKDVVAFKKVLLRSIKPEMQKEFISDVTVDFYAHDKRIAYFQIYQAPTNPFVNFNSENLNFGFQLTYGIGMFLDE